MLAIITRWIINSVKKTTGVKHRKTREDIKIQMGFVFFVRFAVMKCVDVLAWPLFPLGYPMCASIRAIESGSISETNKLVTYWTLLSLILLFEHTFELLLKWLPIWPYIKLVMFCWLAVPKFDGAFNIYNRLVHPCLSFDPKVILQHISNLKKSSKESENFQDAVERFLEENGPEALEKLIAHKLKRSEPPVDAQSESEGEGTDSKEAALRGEGTDSKEAATPESTKLKCCGQPDISKKENGAEVTNSNGPVASEWPQPELSHTETRTEVTDRKNAATAEWVKGTIPEPELSQTSSNTIANDVKEPKGTSAESSARKNNVPKGTSAESTAHKNNVQKEWTCALCQIKTTSEKDLLAHFQGEKHKSTKRKLKQPKSSSPKTSSSTSTSKTCNNHHQDNKQSSTSTNASQWKQATKQEAKVQDQQKKLKKEAGKSQSALWCNLCKIPMPNEYSFEQHLKGRRHLARIQSLAAAAGVTI